MQSTNDRVQDRGGGGDTYVRQPITTRGVSYTSKKSVSMLQQLRDINFPTHEQRPPKTPAPLLGSPSEFMREALLRGLTKKTASFMTKNDKRQGGSGQPTFPPIELERKSTASTSKVSESKMSNLCGSCSEVSNNGEGPLLQELRTECRRQNRNPTLYRIATPLEISRIPEHLRNLKTISLEEPGDTIEETLPSEPPLPYYLPRPVTSIKHRKHNRKQEAYWRWEKPDKTKHIEPPSACRILEEVRRAQKSENGSQLVISSKPPQSVVDVEERDSESEEDDEPDWIYEIVKDPPTRQIHIETPPSPIATTSVTCSPKKSAKNLESGYEYHIRRGPSLLIKTKKHELILQQHQTDATTTKLYIEEFDDFAATTKCIETRKISLINEGTTAIRFQWIRSLPGTCIQKFLGNAAKLLKFGKTVRNQRFPIAIQEDANAKYQQRCGGISSGPKKLALHLTTSRKINPALTRTIKILKNTVSSDTAFQNLLLLLSLRVPRLRRELIRRTQRQLSHRTLSHRIQKLYLQLRHQRRIKFHDPTLCQKRISLDNIPDDTKEFCTCNLSTPSESSDSSQSDASDNFFLFPQKIPHECICTRPSSPPPPPTTAEPEWGPEDMVVPTELLTDKNICYFHPQIECVCEGICICQPPAEDTSLCPCGPCCICSPQVSWGALKSWTGGEDGDKTCSCIGPCLCPSTENVEPLDTYPATPPPSGRVTSQPSCNCLEPCDCGLSSPLGTRQHENLGECDQPEQLECKLLLNDTACACEDPCECDLPEPTCTCGPVCTCATPPFSPSCSQGHLPGACVCQPACSCDLPEDYCLCGPRCICMTPPLSIECLRDTLALAPAPEDCTCSACKCGDFDDCQYLLGRKTQLPLYCGAGDAALQYPHEMTGEDDFDRGHSLRRTPSFMRFCGGDLSSACPGEDGGEGEIYPPVTFQETAAKKTPPKIRKIRKVEFLKPTCPEFVFCELPRILLPGQKFKFEIMFRPQAPGIYSETIYLLTHPRLTSSAYAIHLRGICVNPEHVPETCATNVIRDKTEQCVRTPSASHILYNKMYHRQGKQALMSIMDHVIHLHKEQKPTFPYGRLTSEAIFNAHNHTLFYHPDTSETALHLVKTLVQLLVAKTHIAENSNLCKRNITKLYYELLKPSSEQEYFNQNLMSDEVETLLEELSACTKQLIRPPVFKGVSAQDRCTIGTQVAVHAMIDELLTSFKKIETTAKNPYRTYIWRKVIRGKLDTVREAEIESIIQERREKREAKKIATKIETATQTNLNNVSSPPSTADLNEDNLYETTPQVGNQDIEYQFQQMNKESIYESRLSTAQHILANSIERMLSLIDATENLCDYEKQQVLSTADDHSFKCCP